MINYEDKKREKRKRREERITRNDGFFFFFYRVLTYLRECPELVWNRGVYSL